MAVFRPDFVPSCEIQPPRVDTDRFRFLELLAELPKGYAVRVHACVPMDTHFHLLLEMSEANLSRAMQWLN